MFTQAKDYSDAALAAFGLQARRQPVDFILPALGVLSVGILAGAGLGLLLAPRRGQELRQDIGRGVNRTLQGVAGSLKKVGRGEMFGRSGEQNNSDQEQSRGNFGGRREYGSFDNGHESYGTARPVGGEILGSPGNR